jgi:hypothetical protein
VSFAGVGLLNRGLDRGGHSKVAGVAAGVLLLLRLNVVVATGGLLNQGLLVLRIF